MQVNETAWQSYRTPFPASIDQCSAASVQFVTSAVGASSLQLLAKLRKECRVQLGWYFAVVHFAMSIVYVCLLQDNQKVQHRTHQEQHENLRVVQGDCHSRTYCMPVRACLQRGLQIMLVMV